MLDNRKKLRQISIEMICFGLIMIIIYVVFNTFIGIAVVQGKSMYPTLESGSVILIRKPLREPEIGDIVIIDAKTYGKELIKRVIAKEGDVVDIDFKTGHVYVNSKLIDEPYVNEPTYKDYDIQFPVTVQEGCVFVLGDNRNESIDSRSTAVGQIPIDEIEGIYIRTIKY